MSLPPWIGACITCAAFIVCCGYSVSDESFEALNKCGCYRLLSCPTKAECSAGLNNLEELYEQSSWSSDKPKKCSKCFLEGYKKNITNSDNGTLKILMQFSSYSPFDYLEVQLIYIDLENATAVHSKLYLEEMIDDPCKKVAEFSFSYIFSGSYRLHIKNGYNTCCISGEINLTTSYRKELIKKETEFSLTEQSQAVNAEFTSLVDHIMTSAPPGEKPAQEAPFETSCILRSKPFNHSITSQTGKDLECTFSDKRISEVKSIHVRVANATGNEYFMEAHLTHLSRGNCCDSKGGLNYCPCNWYDNRSLKCIVPDVKVGNYTILLEYIDPRCEDGTLWIKTNDSCVWSWTEVVFQEDTKLGISTELPITSSNAVFFIVVSSGFILFFMFSYLFFKKRRDGNINLHPDGTAPETSLSNLICQDDSDLLLLYPRDCETFMGAMEQFRMILKDSLLYKVYDPWDEDIFDEVAVSLETWSLPLITNDKMKIVIMLSQCSKMMENAYVHDMYNVTYKDPNVLDRIFGQSLKAIYQHFATRSDCYQRVFVVRLDETSDMKLSFHMNCAIIYTIPQGLQTLLNDLAKNCFPRITVENLLGLETSIREYKNLKEHCEDYLNEILEIT